MISLALAVLVAGQGEAVRLELPDEPGLAAVTLSWNGHQVPLARSAAGWFGLLGVDLDQAPGEHAAGLTYRYADGRKRLATETVRVRAKAYPTTRLTVEPKYVELSAEDQARADREAKETAAIYATITPEAYWSAPFQVPVAGVTGGRNFGHRRIFNDQPRAPHGGADLKAANGTPVLAANRGRVVLAKNLFFSGNAVFLDHGLGVYTVYLHLSAIDVGVGELVEAGQVIAHSGATGRVTGPHLHWGAKVLDARVDPFSLLPRSR